MKLNMSNKLTFGISAIMFAFTSFVSVADTTIIVDKIERNTIAMQQEVESLKSIRHDIAQANELQATLETQLSQNAPLKDQIYTANQILQRELSSVNQALGKLDSLYGLSVNIKHSVGELIDELYAEMESGYDAKSKEEYSQKRFQIADQVIALASSLDFLQQNRALSENDEFAAQTISTMVNSHANQRGLHANIEQFQHVYHEFIKVETRLNLERANLKSIARTLEASTFELTAAENTASINTLFKALGETFSSLQFTERNDKSQSLIRRISTKVNQNSGINSFGSSSLSESVANLERAKAEWRK